MSRDPHEEGDGVQVLRFGALWLQSSGCSPGNTVLGDACFRTTFCRDTVSQGGDLELGHLSLLRVPCPLPQQEGAPWQVPAQWVPVTGHGSGWDWAGWGISRFLPGQGLPQALTLSPISQGCSLRN